MNKQEISIILPVLNEEENLKFLIPDIFRILSEIGISDHEIVVVDDNSTDNTCEIVNEFISSNLNVVYKLRSGVKSLPLSIFEGIEIAKYENVLWLDADGSMDAESIKTILNTFFKDNYDVVIGSRFIEGGGYKGLEKNTKSTLKNIINNLNNSEDSALAVYLSILFNNLLKFILSTNIRDLTSGFIVGKKRFFSSEMFNGFEYGEYFVFVVMKLLKNNLNVHEVGYYCKPRKFGKSKTSSSLFRLIRLSYPYLKIAYKSRKELNDS